MPVIISGLSELSEMLTQESARTAKRYLVNCAKPAAEVVIEAMKDTVPVGLTGRLEDELTYQTRFSNGDGTTLIVEIGPARSTWWGMASQMLRLPREWHPSTLSSTVEAVSRAQGFMVK